MLFPVFSPVLLGRPMVDWRVPLHFFSSYTGKGNPLRTLRRQGLPHRVDRSALEGFLSITSRTTIEFIAPRNLRPPGKSRGRRWCRKDGSYFFHSRLLLAREQQKQQPNPPPPPPPPNPPPKPPPPPPRRACCRYFRISPGATFLRSLLCLKFLVPRAMSFALRKDGAVSTFIAVTLPSTTLISFVPA